LPPSQWSMWPYSVERGTKPEAARSPSPYKNTWHDLYFHFLTSPLPLSKNLESIEY
jgi:hypothetical protein